MIRALLAIVGVALVALVVASSGARDAFPAEARAQVGTGPCPGPSEALEFAPQTIIDTTRAGGEPTVETHPDGTLLYGSHAGTTHIYTPEAADPDTVAFPEGYRNQTYLYYSDDRGETWEFVPRDAPDNAPGSGFSDPDWAIDSAGQVYASEINLVNVAVSRSTDSGRSYTLQNFGALTVHDRQWKEADQKDVLYIVGNSFGGGTSPNQPAGNFGHYLYRSTDGGVTFEPGVQDGDGLGDIQVDKSDGTLYEMYYDGDVLSMTVRRGAREGNLDAEVHPIADGVDLLAAWPSFDIDPAGNLYITWDESGRGDREAGIYFSYSTDRGTTWAAPTRVDTDEKTNIWPWLAVGDEGRVAMAWLEADVELPDHDAQTPGDHGWRVIAAQTLNGHGCEASPTPGFSTTVATPEPTHTGTICQGGTACQAQAIDLRLGDYFEVEIDQTGRMYSAYSDTSRGGAVSLPGFVRQTGGPSFIEAGSAGGGQPDGDSPGGGQPGVPAAPQAEGPGEDGPCSNRINGTDDRDQLGGTKTDDRISGRRGDDRIRGRGGDDCLLGKGGQDEVEGNGGADEIRAGGGNDRVEGNGGRDDLRLGRGKDRVDAGAGPDTIHAARGARDRIDCGPGEDKAFVNERKDRTRRCEQVRSRS